MVGIIYLIITIFCFIVWTSKCANSNKRLYKKTYDKDKGTYIDRLGVERKPNGEYCKTTRDPITGDLVQYNDKHKIIKNFSEEKRKREWLNTDSTVKRMSEKNLFYGYNEIKGIRYVDKKTNNTYVIREFRVPINNNKGYSVLFYMDIETSYIVRITDGERMYGELKDYDIINKFINDFNNKQKKYKYYSINEKYFNNNNRDIDLYRKREWY